MKSRLTRKAKILLPQSSLTQPQPKTNEELISVPIEIQTVLYKPRKGKLPYNLKPEAVAQLKAVFGKLEVGKWAKIRISDLRANLDRTKISATDKSLAVQIGRKLDVSVSVQGEFALMRPKAK